jgi:prepilin-type N-terminal cleavage/methylation domain-containing protein
MKTLSVQTFKPERGSVSRSTVKNQDAVSNSFTFEIRARRGSQTRAPGFSLIEVIVAVAILSIAMVGLAHGISTALGSSKEAELQTTAAMYAAGLIENLRAEGELIDGQTEGDCGAELPLYRWTESITPASVDGLHQVDVSILNSHSGQEIYALRTMLFEVPTDSTKKPSDSKSKKKSRQTS